MVAIGLGRTFDPDTITWSVGGKPVALEWTSFESTATGGFGRFGARIMPNRGRRADVWQGDKIIGRKPDGTVVYEGKLMAPPKFVDDVATVNAIGPRSLIDRTNDRLPYQIRGADQWTDLQSDPANFAASDKFEIAQKGNSLGVLVGDLAGATAIAANQNQGYYLQVADWPITNVQFTQRRTVSNGNFDLRVRGTDDTFAAATNVQTFACSAADSTDRDVSFTTEYSVAVIDWNCNNGAATPPKQRFWVDNVRVGVITDQDSFSSSEVAADVANRCNYEADTQGGTNMMPLDWNGPWSDLLNYLSDIEDQMWMVTHSDKASNYGKLVFRPFGHRVWQTQLGSWAEDQGLDVLPLYDQFTTTYEKPAGVQQHLTSSVADFDIRDPLPGESFVYPDPLQLEDPQPDKSLAEEVNQRALKRLTQLRVDGSVKVNFVQRGVPYDIEPGDLLNLGDFQPAIPPQRIAAITYNRDGSVTCSLDRDVRLAALVDRFATRRLRRRNRRRR